MDIEFIRKAIMYVRKWFYMLSTVPRDLRALVCYTKLQWKVWHAKRNNLCVPELFETVAYKKRNDIAFYFKDESWTFSQVDMLSNQIGNYFAFKGVEHGDVIGLFMENRVQYICIWLGLCKIGAIPALISSSIRLKSLQHCIKMAACKAVICGAELQQEICDIQDDKEISKLQVFVSGVDERKLVIKDWVNLDAAVYNGDPTRPVQLQYVNFGDDMLYIYTSGTTGLPKAVRITHSRFLVFTSSIYYFMKLEPRDVIYNPLPLFHSSGGMLGTGQALLFGCCTVIKEKFSSTEYWTDAIKYGATAGQYIGEMCRYLVNQPKKPEDTKHKIRVMFGNGLRHHIWNDFKNRFQIPKICEFYGSTEGNANLINMEGHTGAVGFLLLTAPKIYPVALLKIDNKTKEIVRGVDGMCIKCKPGDILVMDKRGYVYFVDRTGDTFRWKGENVSTMEVEDIIYTVTGHNDVAVYGVQIPGYEGRCGMAAILDQEKSLDLVDLYAALQMSLPVYARPLFIRVVKHLKKTDTFKIEKYTLQEEGYNPSIVSGRLYFMDQSDGAYVPLTVSLYSKIVNHEVRV
ncbi:hypothetical protein OTU49_006107 [Cherax quadricarinatus]|uniref:long-chain-fatty-acid--CoA ligase n=1 Tax=Cherax quadricarinatus TaxID=27406 RepID=A0AAW0WQJ7_CHEQU